MYPDFLFQTPQTWQWYGQFQLLKIGPQSKNRSLLSVELWCFDNRLSKLASQTYILAYGLHSKIGLPYISALLYNNDFVWATSYQRLLKSPWITLTLYKWKWTLAGLVNLHSPYEKVWRWRSCWKENHIIHIFWHLVTWPSVANTFGGPISYCHSSHKDL